MKFIDKRRAGVFAVLAALIGAVALFFGAGSANANSYPCSETEGQDIWVNAAGTYAGVDPGGDATGWLWACVAPTGGEANQKWVVVTAGDPGGGGPGATVQSSGCTGVVPGDPAWPGCTWLLKPTGADTNPTTVADAPGDSNGKTGGSVGAGTCVYANSTTPNCPFGGLSIAGATFAEGDASVGTHLNPGGCVTVAGGCVTTVPSGVGVSAFKGDPANPTIDANVANGTLIVTEDLGDCYVGVNAPSDC